MIESRIRAVVLVACMMCGAAAPRAVAQAPLFRVNCAGSATSAGPGPAFAADQPYGGGNSFGYVGGQTVSFATAIGPKGNPRAAIARTAREGFSAYRFDVQNGAYRVHLHFAEIAPNVHGPGIRKFDISAEGSLELHDFDVAAGFGVQYAGEVVFTTVVADGRLDLDAQPIIGSTLLSAIEVWPHLPDTNAPLVPSGFTAKPGVQRNVLTWNFPAAEPAGDIAHWRVLRAPSPQGPFAPLAELPAGPPRYHDDSAPVGTPVYYGVISVDASGNESATSTILGATALGPADTGLPVYSLTIAPGDLETLNSNIVVPDPPEVPATFEFGGQQWPVYVKYRGKTSKRFSKKSYKVKFPAQQPFLGVRELNLKAYFVDFSLTREPATIALFHAVDHPATTEQPIHLELNGRFEGLYRDIEELDETWLVEHDRATSCDLWKSGGNLTVLASPGDYEAVYEQKTGSGHVPLIDFIQWLATAPDPTFERELLARLDVDDYLDYLAVVGFLAVGDSVTHNFYVLFDPTLARYEIVAWDTDISFGLGQFDLHAGSDLAVDFGTLGSVAGPAAGFGFNQLKTRVLDVPSFRDRYARKLEALIADPTGAGTPNGIAAPAALQSTIDALIDPVVTAAHADVHKYGWESDQWFDASKAILGGFAAPRAVSVLTQLATYAPHSIATTTLWINELAVVNMSGVVDEQGEREPWIELFNSAQQPAVLDGCYLSDDATLPTRWMFPQNTTIAPQGRLVVFLDGEPGDGPLHASFAPNAAGGAVFLTAPDGTTSLDFLHYRPPQLADVSIGRLPDGGAFLKRLPQPSPGSPNVATGSLPPIVVGVHHEPPNPIATDWVVVSAAVTSSAPLSFVTLHWRTAGGPFQQVAMNPLPGGSFEGQVPPHPVGSTIEYYLEAQDALGAASVKPPTAPGELFSYVVIQPSIAGVIISEVMADDDGVLVDEAGDHDDWLEITNTTQQAVDLSGCFVSDSIANSTKWQIPAATILPAKARLIIWCDDEASEGPLHASFKLSKSGEAAALFDSLAAGNALIDGFDFGPQETNRSIGRLDEGKSDLFRLLDPSPGQPNLPAPAATVRYDAAPVGTHTLSLGATRGATLGQPFHLQITGAAPNNSTAWLFGFAQLNTPLPPHGVILVAPTVILTSLANAAGSNPLPVAIPNDPALINTALYVQGWALGSGLSNALVATIGP